LKTIIRKNLRFYKYKKKQKILITKNKIRFQAKSIKKSYRKRGKLERTHKNKFIKIKTIKKQKNPLQKNHPVKILKIIITPYSQIKKKEKKPPPYSVLNPDTNSDSPSKKS